VLVLARWATVRESAALSAAFIFLNSLAGLAGMSIVNNGPAAIHTGWILAAVGGGIAGAYLGSRKLTPEVLRYLLASVLIFASVKLLLH
jgi:uncharacterized membrane protein YfcA